MSSKQSWFERHFALVVALLVMAAVIIIAAPTIVSRLEWRKTETALVHELSTPKPAPDRGKLKLQRWPNPPPPPLPVVEPISFELDDGWRKSTQLFAGNDEMLLTTRLMWLLKSHPNLDLRQELNGLAQAGGVAFDFVSLPDDMLARFRIITAEEARSRSQNTQIDPWGNFPVFDFNRRKLLGITNDAAVRQAAVYLEHEWHHYQQYLEYVQAGRPKESQLIFGSRPPPGQLSEEICGAFWQAEVEAWMQGCSLALRLGELDQEHLICAWSGDRQAFEHMFFNHVDNHQVIPGGDYRECVPVNARLAGHPHPESFAP